LITAVYIRNFKSLANTEFRLRPMTLLVGPNGSGKSNAVDAIRFVGDALRNTLPLAINQRGGVGALTRVSRGHPRNFGVRLRFSLDELSLTGEYAFEVGRDAGETGFSVRRERCLIHRPDGFSLRFETRNGVWIDGGPPERRLRQSDQLALPIIANVAREPEYYDVLLALSNMRFYSPSPERIRELQDPTDGEILLPDGANAPSVIREIRRHHPTEYELICELLSKVVPGVTGLVDKSLGSKETVQFHQFVDDPNPWKFDAANMSDGTLRALAILLAVYQPSVPSLLAIEEPEATIHPAAADVLVDILRTGAERTQVLVTTHSPDVLDSQSVSDDEILIVEKRDGKTTIGPLGETTRKAIRELLYSPGELLRINKLTASRARSDDQLALFPKESAVWER